MKTKTFHLLAICGLITLSFFSCEKTNDTKTTRIIYGYSFGMANASQQIQLNEDLFLYENKSMASNMDKRCSKATDKALLKDILNSPDLKNFHKLPAVYGCPDCADGGAEFIELEIDGKVYRVTYNYGKVPEELTDIVAKLKPVMGSFKDCQP